MSRFTRTIMGAALAAAVFVVSPAASAKTPAKAPKRVAKSSRRATVKAPKRAPRSYARVQRMIFLGSDVEAGVQGPDGSVLPVRPPARIGTLNLVRATFLPELVKSGENI